LLSAVVASYVEACNERPPTPELPPAYRDLPPRRDAVAQARATAATAATQQRAQVTTRPAADKRDTCLARVTELDESCRTLASQLETQRAELEQLSAHTPGGIVTAEALQTALGSDATYREDQKEHELAATAYQRELAVALQGLEAPLAAVQSALGTLATGVQEQRAVPAPTDVGAVLEQTQAEVERCTSQFGALGKAAPQWRQTAESLRAAEHASQLVDLHNSAIETVRLALEAGQTLGQHLQEAAEKLSGAGDGGTRQVVVAALLRSEARPLADAVTALTTAAQKMQFKENPELDTQNRKLRGVLARMNERSQVLKAQLQEAADAQAAREHAVKVDAARTAVSEQIAKREALLSEWGAALKVLRDLDAQLGERRVLEAEAAASEREVKSLDAQLAQIDATLAEARRQGTNPDRLGPVPAVQQEVVPDRNRTRVALLVGACMLAGTWLLLAWAVGDAWPIGRGRPARA
jgi:DNA repair exonuclease SbcCD ATPase subunit